VAEQVYLAAGCDRVAKDLGYPTHTALSMKHTIMGTVFDPDQAAAYVKSFKIHSMA